MFALIGPIISGISSIFGGLSGGFGKVMVSLATSLGVRFYAGLVVGLLITDNKVRDAAITLGKDIVGAVL